MKIVLLESGLVVIEQRNCLAIYEEGHAPSMEMTCIYVWENKHLDDFKTKEELQNAIEDLEIFGQVW